MMLLNDKKYNYKKLTKIGHVGFEPTITPL